MTNLKLHEIIENRIILIRGHRVMLSPHLAELYAVETRALVQAVKRNIKRFPEDFMFQIYDTEVESLVSQNVIPHKKYLGGSLPYAFTEQGVAMLSSVLKSDKAIEVNITIMRAFVKLREILSTHKDLALKLNEMESKYDSQFKTVFDVISQLMNPAIKPKRIIGFGKDSE
ncbi:MAG: ORF6N domain-containing protein [Nitrospirae bacterium]|nr:ORF6N domain-containing protein [Nitrospirota bacterium]MBF0617824.1 ORF6N domain-containing protein [Nitrospirota bacterium]